MNELEKKLLAENEKLTQENQFLKALLQDVSTHLIDIDGEEWFCMVCGERAPMAVENDAFPHKKTCVLHKENKV